MRTFCGERAVPCYRRASAVTGAAEQAEAIVAGEGGNEEDWVAPERTGGAAPSADGNQDDGIPTLGEDAAGRADVRCPLRLHICATDRKYVEQPNSRRGTAVAASPCIVEPPFDALLTLSAGRRRRGFCAGHR